MRRTPPCRGNLAQRGRRNTEKNQLRPDRQQQWCIGQIDARYLAAMEDVLAIYNLPFDPLRPVICLDEMPVQLLGEAVEPLPMRAGKPRRADYEYIRNGVASVFIALEPLSGRRICEVKRRRTKSDYCDFIETIAAAYPKAETIVLVQDNLNTHSASSFYENRQPAAAFELMRRFEFHFTPRKGSWLNMAELELSALSRQCLRRRRIESIERLESELNAVVKERNEKQIKVSWQFTKEHAREKLRRHYEEVKSKN